ncbi:MAG: hypothetical protein QNK18_08740 [Gammaproteobacteria bacterium]|nr:hypothetical protein [Gammaproteobacteria bacterium]
MLRHILTALIGLTLLATTACTQQQVVIANASPAVSAPQPVTPVEQLNVAVVVFDPGVEDGAGKVAPSPGMRRAEARYMAYLLRRTLEDTNLWGEVNVVPAPPDSTDLTVNGRILVSNGLYLELEIHVTDATGRSWFKDKFQGGATRYSYEEQRLRTTDPFQGVYNAIADRMAEERKALDETALERIRQTSEMRFARDLAPSAFQDYVSATADGRWQVQRLPAEQDPMMARIRAVRQRDRAFMRVLDGYYGEAHAEMRAAYDGLRKASYEEALALGRAERAARNNMILGAVAVVAGVAGAAGSSSSLGQSAGVGSALGGVIVAQRGLQKSEEAATHRESLRELDNSFTRAVEPKVMEVEGKVITLSGSAQEQFREWRALLREIYQAERGLPGPVPGRDEPAR